MDPPRHKLLLSLPFLKTRQVIFCLISFLILLFSSLFVFDLIGLSISFEPLSLFRILPSSLKSPQKVCDYSYGRWVRKESYMLQAYTESCQFLDPGFRCLQNGRKDIGYLNWQWQPHGCDIPRFNASDLLERSRNGRIVFAGDSIGRNQWESFLCLLAQGVSNKSTIYEKNGKPISKHKGFLSMQFSEYNLTVEYYRVPFLVYIGPPPPGSPTFIRSTIKVNRLHRFSKRWAGADILVFNSGHWWNKHKTVKMHTYFEDGGKLNTSMDVIEAFQRSLQTLRSWATKQLHPTRSHIFFCSYSPVHYMGGTWKEGGRCDGETQPETNHTSLRPESVINQHVSNVVKQMKSEKWKAQLLNITYLSEFRFDGHPSSHREPGTLPSAPQDCSHWCLPGTPDIWNEMLYAHLLSMEFRTK